MMLTPSALEISRWVLPLAASSLACASLAEISSEACLLRTILGPLGPNCASPGLVSGNREHFKCARSRAFALVTTAGNRWQDCRPQHDKSMTVGYRSNRSYDGI